MGVICHAPCSQGNYRLIALQPKRCGQSHRDHSMIGPYQSYQRNTGRFVVCRASSIRARWCFDCRYGTKMKGVALVQEWVRDIGSRADPALTPKNVRIHSGSIGSPESRLELEVEFASLDELERFWGSIPGDLHQEWSQNLADIIVDGSPTWEVYRSVEAFVDVTSSIEVASSQDIDKYAKASFGSSMKMVQDMMSEDTVTKNKGDQEGKIVLDWKGDPMHINPGDKLPFTFD